MRVLITGGSGFIGTNAVEHCRSQGHEVQNLDRSAPRNLRHKQYWQPVDIRDRAALEKAVIAFGPTHVLHLAAVTSLNESGSSAYAANVDGVASLIEAVAGCATLERIVFASSLLVCRVGYAPRTDTDYCPSTPYGQSKVIGERIVRESARLSCPWVIARPTSIWGPWFDEPYRNFFLMIARGRYVHPGRRPVPKAHGFVGNTVHMLMAMLTAPAERVAARTFYCMDYPRTSVHEWAEHVRSALGAPAIRTLPMPLMRLAAAAGSGAERLGLRKMPLTRFRLNNMLTHTPLDPEEIRSLSGPLPYDIRQGVEMTVDWLREQGLVKPAARRLSADAPAASPPRGHSHGAC